MKVGLELSSLSSVIVCNLLLVMRVEKPNLEIHIKWVHGKRFCGCIEIFGNSFIRSLTVRSNFSTINVKEPHSMGNGVIPPLNPPSKRVGPRFKVQSF